MRRGIPTDVGVECDNCGLTKGSLPVGADTARCRNCGQFAEQSYDYCGKHEVNIRRLTGHGHCPACREEERVAQMRHEQMERRADPRMHTSVDAPRF